MTGSAPSWAQAFSWLIVSLTFLITYEVFSRYALDAPHDWAFDGMIQMYGMLFMMAGAYTLSKNNMVRGDVLYGFFPPRVQAGLDLTLYFVFFLPGVTALCWAGYTYALDAWAIWEHSGITANGPPIYQFKTIIPDRRGVHPPSGDRRDDPLRPVPQDRPVALAHPGRRGGRRRETEGDGGGQPTRISRSSISM